MKFINEVYRKSGLGKWFHDESAGGKPGWDRYNSKGERVGECGDAKKGEPYAACLSKQKARKLGKENHRKIFPGGVAEWSTCLPPDQSRREFRLSVR